MRSVLLVFIVLAASCDDEVTNPPPPDNEGELITTVTLTFTPTAGTDALSFTWFDLEGDGSPVIDPIVLSDADDYDLAVSFLNEQSSPPEDITAEVDEESDQHQVFFTGAGVVGPATGDNPAALIEQAYADADVNGFPVGLASTITTLATGTSELIVTLRHLPPEGAPVKTGTLADVVAADGLSALPGDTDVEVTFDLTVLDASRRAD